MQSIEHMHDHKVKTELDAESMRYGLSEEEEINQGTTSVVTQSCRQWFLEAARTRGWLTKTNVIHAYKAQSLIAVASDCVGRLLSGLVYECSNTIEHRMIAGGSNCERLTNVDKLNCYICKVAQYLDALTYALVDAHVWQCWVEIKQLFHYVCISITYYCVWSAVEQNIR